MSDQIEPVADQTTHYEPPRKKRGADSPKMQPPMTPMIDVTFQLLLFFMLSFTFREFEGQIPGALPKKGTGASAASTLNKPIFISVRSVGVTEAKYEIRGYNEIPESPQRLREMLEQIQETTRSKEGPVIIAPDAFVQWGHVVEVFNQAVRLDFENVGFAPIGST
ncbi:MAG: ExbD/TolR family protein [Planctomycetota bacterium]|jgi:biopolymer transport protein ExbD